MSLTVEQAVAQFTAGSLRIVISSCCRIWTRGCSASDHQSRFGPCSERHSELLRCEGLGTPEGVFLQRGGLSVVEEDGGFLRWSDQGVRDLFNDDKNIHQGGGKSYGFISEEGSIRNDPRTRHFGESLNSRRGRCCSMSRSLQKTQPGETFCVCVKFVLPGLSDNLEAHVQE